MSDEFRSRVCLRISVDTLPPLRAILWIVCLGDFVFCDRADQVLGGRCGMDPKPKSEKRRRTTQILVRVTPDEYAAIDDSAAADRLSPAAYLRAAGLGGGDFVRRDAAQIVGALGRVGNNLNQLTVHAHRGRLPAAQELDAVITDLRGVIEQIADGRKER